ncbi:hypothetical protein ABGB16_10055 [Micromonospora sp. B11E3]|uniref:hypothetical protein n=1 Tax=Micromonospora sp. B11E3 TaxID=3153562 RepID=UPI00325EA8C6
MGRRRVPRLLGPVAALALLAGCTGVAVGDAPREGNASYQVWGLNEASSDLTGSDRTVVLNGDLDNDSKAFFTVDGTWRPEGFVLDDASAEEVRTLAGKLPDRTGDPRCRRLVLVDGGLVTDRAVAVLTPPVEPAAGPVTAARLDG